ncbi:TonB-dependent receptor [Prevotella sp. P6B1]|uniref:SusC/RagA family TonB-linked outer membrane protein n=1 Tax=Prevotella sp. P6B1 TaxID=1410613 RepID=UPI0009DF58EB|nr:TonB-dependent receptor [Prevotella sp. P6B1]
MWNFKSIEKPLMALFLLCLFPLGALAQSLVKGTVNDEAGEPIIGATVKVQGTQNGAITDFNGNFQIQAASNATLNISYVGYVPQTVKVAGKTNITIVLKEDAQMLNDIVVVGYGTMKKSDITGSVVSVNTEDVMKKSPVNVSQALQGAAPGVIVTMQDGQPGAKAQIRIRGVATINGSAAPLYVVDGVQVGDNADFVSPSDIESIDVLKDASATAIYGSAGANGVIMITTKHGSKGHSNINITADFGIQTLSSKLDVCSGDQYAANLRQARINDGQVDGSGNAIMWNPVWNAEYDGKRKYTDWQDVMTRSALRQNYNVSTSGGNEKTQYNASLGFLRNDGLVVNTQYQRITARANVNSQVNKYIAFGADVSWTHTDSYGSNVSVGNFGNLSSLRDFAFACPSMDFVTNTVVTYDGVPAGTYISPNVVNPDGTFGDVTGGKNFNDGFWGTTLGNMYAKQMDLHGRNRSNRTLSTAYLTITPIDGLSWKTLLAYDYYAGSNENFYGGIQRVNYVNGERIDVTQGKGDAYYNPSENNDYRFDLGNNESQTLRIQNTLTYNWSNDIHNVTVMLGNEVSRWYGQWVGGSSVGYDSKDNRDLGLTTQPTKRNASGGLNLESRMISYFARASYSLMDRYLLTATIRRDGSSNFGSGNRWGTFPSVAAGWRISEEAFMKDINWINNLKLRFGWGQTGNSGGATDMSVIGLNVDGRYIYYKATDPLGLGTGTPTVTTGYYNILKDTNLKWETNEQLNFGIDAAFFNSQLVIGVDYFIRKSKDLLLWRNIRPSSGYANIYTNYGEIENKGLEFMVGFNKRINKDFSINATLTGSTLTNKVNKMGDPIYNTNSDSSGQGTGDGSNTGAVGAADGYHWGNHSICKEGEAVGSFYGYRVEGIIKDQAMLDKAKAQGQTAKMGDYLFKDLNNDGVLNESDMDILGNGFPSLNYGLTLGANYKDFDFTMQMHGVFGQKIYSYSAMRLTNMFCSDDGTSPNILASAAANAWSESNPNGSEARLSILDENYNMRASDAWVKNGDFLKISNIQVGYTIPKSISSKLLIQNARIYLAVQNVCCISGYNKYGDPECGQGSVLYTGLDTGRYPMPRTYSCGINVTF